MPRRKEDSHYQTKPKPSEFHASIVSTSEFDTEGLIEYFRERTKESLRGVYTYNEYGNITAHYVRDDVKETHDNDILAKMLRKAVIVESALREVEPDGTEVSLVGDPKASMHTFENAVVVQIVGPSINRGVLAAFDKDIATRHTKFVDEAIARWTAPVNTDE